MKTSVEDALVHFSEGFARYRFVIAINNDFKIKLTPNADRAAYIPRLTAPLNPKEDIWLKLAHTKRIWYHHNATNQ